MLGQPPEVPPAAHALSVPPRRAAPPPAGPDALTFDLMSIGGKIRAGLGALGFKAPMPGGLPLLPLPVARPTRQRWGAQSGSGAPRARGGR